MLTLFPGESVVSYTDGSGVTLTTHRISKQEKEPGKSYHRDIMLEHITSCEEHTSLNGLLLILSLFAFFIAVTAGLERIRDAVAALIIGVALLLAYFLTRKKQITIASHDTKMNINVSTMSKSSIAAFADKVQQTKNNRIVELNQKNTTNIFIAAGKQTP
jgi:hypothetical protein